ncbi:MAG: 4'-phosphopantetheinyl transferase superfamily protein [Acidobacteriota bacterium]
MSASSPIDAVHVWLTPVSAVSDARRRAVYESLLTAEEHQRLRRFIPDEPRREFLVGRALARLMLTRFGGAPPEAWRFRLTPHGRPELADRPPGVADLRFNLSHTRGLVACALTVGRELGVDVEYVRRPVTHDVAERFFSAREAADLRALPEAERPSAFFDYWTLKEAYIKARGLGLALPLGQFTFARSADGRPPRVTFDPALDDRPETWQFALRSPTPDHRLAVAVRRSGPDLPLVVDEVVPEVPAA